MEDSKPLWHKSLRSSAINYRSGWWSVSIQVAKNKSILGAIVGEKKDSALAERVLISTFTSAQEREALRRALAKGKPIIMVVPGGIPSAAEISPELAKALDENRALLISPQPTGSRLNKKVATWCNEYVLRQASEIWAGDISPNGMLSSMLAGMGLKKGGAAKSGGDCLGGDFLL